MKEWWWWKEIGNGYNFIGHVFPPKWITRPNLSWAQVILEVGLQKGPCDSLLLWVVYTALGWRRKSMGMNVKMEWGRVSSDS